MPVDYLMQNWPTMLGLVLFALVAYWFIDEWRDADQASDAVKGAGERADAATGQFLGAVGALVFAMATIGMTVGQQIMETLSMVEPLIGNVPVIIGHLVVSFLGYLSLTGYIGLSAKEFGFAVILITIVALFVRYGRD